VLRQVLDWWQVLGLVLVVGASILVLGARPAPETPDAAVGPG
jgi:inner membrane transporter RhtA